MKKDQIRPSGKSKMTVMLVQLEGDDQTVQQGIQTISQALGNAFTPKPIIVTKPVSALPTPEQETEPTPEGEETTNNGNGHDEQEAENVQPRASRSPSKSRTPQILNLDLKSAAIPLKEFCEAKQVGDNDSRKYLVIAFWLKENLKITAVTMDHIHTCYRFLGWQTPADASGPFRSMKQRGWFGKGSETGSYEINHIGENEVMGMGAPK